MLTNRHVLRLRRENNMSEKIDRFEHDKSMMCMLSCNRRMFFVTIIICIAFVVVIALNSIRQERWINAFLKVVAPVTEVADGTQQSGNP